MLFMTECKRYIIHTTETIQFSYALSKARYDVERLAVERGYKPVSFRSLDSAHGNHFMWLRLGILCVYDWICFFIRVEKGAIILLQYPHLPLKSAPIVRFFLPIIARAKRCTFVAFIHDLDSMRAVNGSAAVYSDTKLLRMFQRVICHNSKMKEVLPSLGVRMENIYQLNLFDYLCDDVPDKSCFIFKKNNVEIAFAGNLSNVKSGFLYQLNSLWDSTVLLKLYGNGYCKIKSTRVQYLGIVSPQKLPAILDATFGLVWDGSSTETCSGTYGQYLTLNNPHKVSLYLAAGIPVIIWEGSALAEFITKNGLGVSVSSLAEIPHVIACIDDIAYKSMRENAQYESRKVRTGYYFNTVLDDLEPKCLIK